jgi:hypothetical protein
VVTNTANSQNTAKNSGGTATISLFLQIAKRPGPRNSAQDKKSIADKSLENSKNSRTRRAAGNAVHFVKLLSTSTFAY